MVKEKFLDRLDKIGDESKVLIVVVIVFLFLFLLFKQVFLLGASTVCVNSNGTLFDSPEFRCIIVEDLSICRDGDTGLVRESNMLFNFSIDVGGVDGWE